MQYTKQAIDFSDQGHGDRYIGSLFRVDEPVPDDSSPMIRELLLQYQEVLPPHFLFVFRWFRYLSPDPVQDHFVNAGIHFAVCPFTHIANYHLR